MAEVVGYVACDGRVRVTPAETVRETAPIVLNGSRLAAVVRARADEPLDVFTDAGLCYGASLAAHGPGETADSGAPLVELIEGDSVCAVHPGEGTTHYAFVSEHGLLKRVSRRTIAKADADGIVAFRLPLDDRLVAVVPHGADDELLIATVGGKLLRIDLESVRPVLTADAGGVTGIALLDGDRVVSACRAEGDELLVLHAGGAAKRVPLMEYPRKGRATGGVASAHVDKPTRTPAGEVSAALAVSGEPVALFTACGRLVLLDLARIAVGTRAAVSKPALKLDMSDRVCGLIPAGARMHAGRERAT